MPPGAGLPDGQAVTTDDFVKAMDDAIIDTKIQKVEYKKQKNVDHGHQTKVARVNIAHQNVQLNQAAQGSDSPGKGIPSNSGKSLVPDRHIFLGFLLLAGDFFGRDKFDVRQQKTD